MRPIKGRSGGAVVVFSATLLDGSVGDGGGVGGVGLILEADFVLDCMRSAIDLDCDWLKWDSETNSDSDSEAGVAGGVG